MSVFLRLKETVSDMLAGPSGCQWLQSQTWRSIANYSQEEVYELIDAIDKKDFAGIKSELADFCFHLLIYTQMGEKEGRFTLDDIAQEALDKLQTRRPASNNEHAHVAHAHWQRAKHQEKQKKKFMLLDDVPNVLPALLQSKKYLEALAQVGFAFSGQTDSRDKLQEELEELDGAIEQQHSPSIEHELGDVLLACVGLSEQLGVNPEQALLAANARLKSRFDCIGASLSQRGENWSSLDKQQLLDLYQQAKRSTSD